MPDDQETKKVVGEIKACVATQMSAIYGSGRIWDDGVILPQDTRKVSNDLIHVKYTELSVSDHLMVPLAIKKIYCMS